MSHHSIAEDNSSLFERVHIGGGAHYSITNFDVYIDAGQTTRADSEIIDNKNDSSWGGYVQAGKNWQVSDSWVLGGVIDYHHLNTSKDVWEASDYADMDADYLMSVRGKAGYLINPRTLVYGTAGLARYKAKLHASDNADTTSGSKSFSNNMAVIGAGVNWFTSYSDNLSFQLELLHYYGGGREQFREDELTNDMDNGDFARIRQNTALNFGINYHFGAPTTFAKTASIGTSSSQGLFNSSYLGGGAHYSITNFDVYIDSGKATRANSEIIDNKNDSSWGGYVQAGKNWQVSDSWVLGGVIDYHHLNTSKDVWEASDYADMDADYLMSVRGKAGYLINPRTLVYGTAGLARYKAKLHASDNADTTSGSKSFSNNMAVIGAGVNWFTSYSDNLSFQLELLHYYGGGREQFREDELTNDMDNGDFARIRQNTALNFGINYHF